MSEQQIEPTYLYKYRSLAGDAKERTKQSILENSLWFSKPADFNDPFDCAPSLSVKSDPKAFRRFLWKLFRKKGEPMSRRELRTELSEIGRDPDRRQNSPVLLANLRASIARVVNAAGILSLSARPDEVLMWSHYAAAHTGICLRFKASAFPFNTAQKVIYTERRPVLNPVLDDHEAVMSKSLLTKADFWSYEEEWRAMNYTVGPGLHGYDPWALDGIILGARTSSCHADEVRGWIRGRQHPVAVLKCRPNLDRFRIDVVPDSEGGEVAGTVRISGARANEVEAANG